jgi:hypothetical protein
MKTIVNFPKITKNGVVQRSLRVMKIKNITPSIARFLTLNIKNDIF